MKISHNRNLYIISSLCAIPIIAIFLLTFSVNVYASDYFPMSQNGNEKFTSGMISAIESQFNFEDNFVFVYTYSFAYGEYYCYAAYVSKSSVSDPPMFGEITNAGYSFNLYPLSGITLMKFSINPTSNVIRTYPTAGTSGNNYTNLPSSLYNSDYDYLSNFDVFTNNTSSATLVLKYHDDPNYDVSTTGHAVPYDPLELPTFALGIVGPNAVPLEYVPVGHSWGTYVPPSFDSSDPVGSLFDITSYNFSYLKDNLTGSINNLANNISGMGNNITSNIQYYGGLIISAINNSIKTFYLNMLSLIQPITVIFSSLLLMGTVPGTDTFSFAQLTNVLFVPKTENVLELVLAHDEFSVVPFISAVSIKGQYIFNQLTSVAPKKTFHIPSCYYHGLEIGNFDIDFSWYDNYKVFCDTIINGFLITGYIIWLFVTFKDHLRGHFVHDVDHDLNVFRG